MKLVALAFRLMSLKHNTDDMISNHILYFIDDNARDGRANAGALQRLLDAEDIEVRHVQPYPRMSEYHQLLADPNVKAFFIDQRMKSGSDVNYNGTDLATFLRGHYAKFPIYILTAFKKETAEFEEHQHSVEDIIGKNEIESSAPNSKAVRARVLRRIAVYADVLDETEQRFHDLLVKSLTESLTDEELEELDMLETERKILTRGADLTHERKLEQAIEILNRELEGLDIDDE